MQWFCTAGLVGIDIGAKLPLSTTARIKGIWRVWELMSV
jgi:hypothetical protein